MIYNMLFCNFVFYVIRSLDFQTHNHSFLIPKKKGQKIFNFWCTSTDYNPCTISFLYFITNLACSTFASGALLTPLIPNPINSFDLIFGTGNITHFQKIHPNFKYPQPSFFGRKIYFKYLTNKRFSQRFPSRQK